MAGKSNGFKPIKFDWDIDFSSGDTGSYNPSGLFNYNPEMGTSGSPVVVGDGAKTGLNQSGSAWGNFGSAMQGVGSLIGAYGGLKQLSLAKKQFQWGKDTYNTNLLNQANLTNARLEDRQRTRQYWNPDAMSPEAYLAKYGVASSNEEAKSRQAQQSNAWSRSQALNKDNKG